MYNLNTQVVSFRKKRFTFGMLWDLPDVSKPHSRRDLMMEAYHYSKNLDQSGNDSEPLKYVAFRMRKKMNDRVQYGMAPKVDNISRSQSAAALLSGILNGTWIGFLKIEESKWWCIQVLDDVIVQDVVYLNEDQAISEFNSHISSKTFDKIYVDPENVEMDERFSEINLSSFLEQGSSARLYPIIAVPKIFQGGKKNTTLIVGVVLLAIFGGYKLYQHHQATLELENNIRLANKLKADQDRQKLAQRVVVTAPWVGLTDVSSMGLFCEKAWSNIPLSVPGYHLGRISCSPSGVSASFSIESYGIPAWSRQYLDEKMKDLHSFSYNISPDGKILTETVEAKDLKKQQIDGLMSVKDYQRSLSDFYYFFKDSTNMVFSPAVRAVAPKSEGDRSSKNFELPWYTIKISFKTSEFMPWLHFFSLLPGTNITSINYDLNEKTWSFEGIAYAR